MTPCRRCNALGFITVFGDPQRGRVEICPDCAGHKYLDPPARELLGTCTLCAREIHFPGTDIPCTVDSPGHTFAGAPTGEAEDNG